LPELIEQFDEIRRHFLTTNADGALPLLVGALGEGSGFGVYQLLDAVIARCSPDVRMATLLSAVASPRQTLRSWGWEFALPYRDARLVDLAARAIDSEARDEQYFAAAYLADHGSNEILRSIEPGRLQRLDPETRQLIEEAVARS
jgi:hypothetical protein